MLHRYKVKQVLYPALDFRSDIYDEWLSLLEEKLGSENIYRTDERGTIEFITNGKRLWVKK